MNKSQRLKVSTTMLVGRPRVYSFQSGPRILTVDPFHLVVYALDLLHLDGADLRPKAFSERRQKLVGLDKPLSCLFVID